MEHQHRPPGGHAPSATSLPQATAAGPNRPPHPGGVPTRRGWLGTWFAEHQPPPWWPRPLHHAPRRPRDGVSAPPPWWPRPPPRPSQATGWSISTAPLVATPPPPADFLRPQPEVPPSLPPSLLWPQPWGYRPGAQCLSWEVPSAGQFSHHLSGDCCLKWVEVRSSGAHRSPVAFGPSPSRAALLPTLHCRTSICRLGWHFRRSEDPALPTDTDVSDSRTSRP